VLFKFDGKFYRQSECYDVWGNDPDNKKVKKAACK